LVGGLYEKCGFLQRNFSESEKKYIFFLIISLTIMSPESFSEKRGVLKGNYEHIKKVMNSISIQDRDFF